ncbi:MAG: ABC transporter ATP-binding protein [Oscillospiraceae bacterium]|nr:ABC transporter ATP-binding protein [Oscillospiraceae bacterium]MDD4368485.1 ABC transporter ATP-binding protein [Oscillospiraceae bacterium]
MTTTRILEVKSLSKNYGQGPNRTEALRGISFEVLEGEFLGIMGASGSGKTTLLNCLATMLRPSSGQILLNGQDLAALTGPALADYRGQVIGYLFQEFELLDNLTVRENILLPLLLHHRPRAEAETSLSIVSGWMGLEDLLEQFPVQLSGGQKQRTAAARALISQPSLVLADEPTGQLDSVNARQLMDRLALIHESEHKTLIMVTHDSAAASFCSRILFIQDGQLYHELRRQPQESRQDFYVRLAATVTQLGGGQAHVL